MGRRIIDPAEMTTKEIGEYVLLALYELGEETWNPICERAENIAWPHMSPADKHLKYRGKDGKDHLVYPGYTGETIGTVWYRKAHLALKDLQAGGFVEMKNEETRIYTLTDDGLMWIDLIEKRQEFFKRMNKPMVKKSK